MEENLAAEHEEEKGSGDRLFHVDRVLVKKDGRILEMGGGDGYTTMWMNLMPLTELYTQKWLQW